MTTPTIPGVTDSMRVMELMASRLCHDLISPVGAINNGIELFEEMGASVGEEAVKLIGHSATQASRRLKLFRLCYGAAGSEQGLGFDDVLLCAKDYLAGGRVTLNWNTAEMKGLQGAPRGMAKVLINTVIIAAETLVHGGTITVTGKAEAGRIHLTLDAEGRAAGTRTELWPALRSEVPVDALSAKTIHPHLTRSFATFFGIDLAFEQPSDDKLIFTLAGAQVQA